MRSYGLGRPMGMELRSRQCTCWRWIAVKGPPQIFSAASSAVAALDRLQLLTRRSVAVASDLKRGHGGGLLAIRSRCF
jgi:hypothetical protein